MLFCFCYYFYCSFYVEQQFEAPKSTTGKKKDFHISLFKNDTLTNHLFIMPETLDCPSLFLGPGKHIWTSITQSYVEKKHLVMVSNPNIIGNLVNAFV